VNDLMVSFAHQFPPEEMIMWTSLMALTEAPLLLACDEVEVKVKVEVEVDEEQEEQQMEEEQMEEEHQQTGQPHEENEQPHEEEQPQEEKKEEDLTQSESQDIEDPKDGDLNVSYVDHPDDSDSQNNNNDVDNNDVDDSLNQQIDSCEHETISEEEQEEQEEEQEFDESQDIEDPKDGDLNVPQVYQPNDLLMQLYYGSFVLRSEELTLSMINKPFKIAGSRLQCSRTYESKSIFQSKGYLKIVTAPYTVIKRYREDMDPEDLTPREGFETQIEHQSIKTEYVARFFPTGMIS
jgi:hypothetical protein